MFLEGYGIGLAIQPFADQCERGVTIHAKCAHHVWHGAIHVAPAAGAQLAEKTVYGFAAKGVGHDTRI